MMINEYLPEGMLRADTLTRESAADAMHTGKILSAPVTMCDCTTMDLRIEFGWGSGVIPAGEAVYCPDGAPPKDIALISRVGRPTAFKVMGMRIGEDGRPQALLSRKTAQRECAENYISSLRPGDIIPAVVTHLDPFGAFVDIGCGIISLLSVDCVSVSRVSHPSDRLYAGQQIMAVVREICADGRIYMSLRELLGTWEENSAYFSPMQTVTGIVRSIEDYGIFVELSPNLAGLAEKKDGIEAGDCCSVYIKSIIPERMKVKLVIIGKCPPRGTPDLKYYIDTEKVTHIDLWKYSPECCMKTVETRFC
jgi:small subunit ribosomal protein S1